MSTFINNQRLAQLAGVNYDSEEIKPGPIVYSRTHTVFRQFPKLATFPDCVLITSFSDAECTNYVAKRLPGNVRRWYSNNVSALRLKVTAVPIGIRTSPEGEVHLRAAIDRGRLGERNLVYMNFTRRLRRAHNPRRGLYERFGGMEWITVEGGFDHVPMPAFYEQIASHPFVLSPPGAGPDCHRHWEAIMLGSIPIVLRSQAVRLLRDMPCLMVSSWDKVTEARLLAELPGLQERFDSPAIERVWFDYWEREIKATAGVGG